MRADVRVAALLATGTTVVSSRPTLQNEASGATRVSGALNAHAT